MEQKDATIDSHDEHGGLFSKISHARVRDRSSALPLEGTLGEVLKYLLDTDVVSQMSKDRPHPRVDAWFRRTENETMYLSVVTLAELRMGAMLLSNGPKRRKLEEWLGSELMDQFGFRLLPIGLDIADAYAGIAARARKAGFTPGAMDCLIAATAMANGLKIATLNRMDFLRMGMELVDF